MMLGFGFTAVIFSLLLSVAVHYLFGAFRIADARARSSPSRRAGT